MYSRPTGVRLKGDGDRPTVSPAKNSLVYFLSIAYIDRPVWRSHPEEAKRRPPSGHRIPRNAGAMMSLLLPSATTRGSLIAGWCVIGAPPRGQPRTPVWWTFRRPCMGRPVPCELLRNEWLDAITIVPVTAYHRRSHNAPAKRGRYDFFLTRPDGTTAAERFFGQKPRSMFTAILDAVDIPTAPLSPPKRAVA